MSKKSTVLMPEDESISTNKLSYPPLSKRFYERLDKKDTIANALQKGDYKKLVKLLEQGVQPIEEELYYAYMNGLTKALGIFLGYCVSDTRVCGGIGLKRVTLLEAFKKCEEMDLKPDHLTIADA